MEDEDSHVSVRWGRGKENPTSLQISWVLGMRGIRVEPQCISPKHSHAPHSQVECSCHVKTRPRKHTVRCRMLLSPGDCGKGHCSFPQPDPGCQQQCCHSKVPGITLPATLQQSQVVYLNKCRAGSGLTSHIEVRMPLFLVLSIELDMEPRSLLGRLSTSEPHPQPIVDTLGKVLYTLLLP